MNKEPETTEELIRKKRCIDLTKYYELSMEELEQIYKFLEDNPNGKVTGGQQNISLISGVNQEPIVIIARLIDPTIDGLNFGNDFFNILPHYDPSSSYYSSRSYSGGSSSNNNNNNNNR